MLCQYAATSRGNRDVPSGARSACRMRATLQAPVCPAGTRKRGGRHRISPDLLRLHAEPSRGAGLLRNSGRCTSFSLNLHTSLMRHPSRLPRPTVAEALRMNNPRCSKGALALAPRHDFTWIGNPCFCFSSVLKAEKWISIGIHYGAQGKRIILRKRGRGLRVERSDTARRGSAIGRRGTCNIG